LLGGLKRSLLTGTNMYMDKLYFESDPGEAVVAPRFPGQIAEVQLEQDMFAHSHSFLAAENEVEIGSKSLGVRSLLANDTLFWVSLQRNPGKKVWLSFFGDVIKMDVKANERVSIEHGHFVAINADAKFNIRFLGIKRALLGGEGLYMVDIEGPAQVWLQTRNLEAFIQMVAAQVPRR
ncbi:MAG TPA: TIGR00266 family protein, partial [Thermoplasmataceae archaeon]|nr:TIGR00266 family protein [Thermoplasmataceae archaeon]